MIRIPGDGERNIVFSGMIWTIAERISASGISIIVSIVLARILLPSDFGLIAMIMIFIALADVFVNSGFSAALIQKKDATEEDFSTVFYCSLVVSMLIYGILYFTAPYIAAFFEEEALTLLLRVFALRIPLSVYNAIQHAYVSRNMLFKRFFFSTSISTIASGVIGIVMALNGFGAYALVGQYLVKTIFDTIVLSITVDWHPRKLFSWSSFKELFGFGVAVLVADLSGTFFDELRSLVIGKIYTSADLAFYNQGKQFPNLIKSSLGASIMTVLFPAIANYADDPERVRLMVRRALKTMAFIFFPIMIGLACVAEPLIELLLTDKWSDGVLFLQILSLAACMDLWGGISLQALKATGKGVSLVKLELVKKPIYLVLLVVGAQISVGAIAVTMLLYSFYGTTINMNELSKQISYPARNQFSDILPETLLSIFIGCIVYSINYLPLAAAIKLVIQMAVGVILYAAIARRICTESYLYTNELLKEKLGQLKYKPYDKGDCNE